MPLNLESAGSGAGAGALIVLAARWLFNGKYTSKEMCDERHTRIMADIKEIKDNVQKLVDRGG